MERSRVVEEVRDALCAVAALLDGVGQAPKRQREVGAARGHAGQQVATELDDVVARLSQAELRGKAGPVVRLESLRKALEDLARECYARVLVLIDERQQRLREAGIERLILCGATANHCVESTTRSACDLGFEAIYVSDAVWAYGVTGPDGVLHKGDSIHSVVLATLEGEIASVRPTATVLTEMMAG